MGIVFVWCPRENDSGFWIGKYEVTRHEFNLVTPVNPRQGLASLPNHPRDGIQYQDVQQFIFELNRQERFFNRLAPNWEYSLPTETQWSHACQADSKPADIHRHANYADASLFNTGEDYFHYADRRANDGNSKLAIVGAYPPNSLGIHDLYGNLWEWTSSIPATSAAPYHMDSAIACGGSWVSLPADCGPNARRRFPKQTERDFIGFRLILHRPKRLSTSSK